ncbi:hypothetical protein [Hymenobacter swuensis]|nr:hypothetical protein [Hymenobacter swuensis]
MATVLASPALASSDGVADKFQRLKVYGQRGQTVILNLSNSSLIVKGSLPTFLQGHNNELLTFTQIGQVVRELAEWVGLAPERLETRRLELSADARLASDVRAFLESLRHHKGSNFSIVLPTKGAARPLEYVSTHVDMWVKFYDQSKYAAQEGYPVTVPNKVRYEVVARRARAVSKLLGKGKAAVTLADLATPATYAAAAAALLRVFGEVERERPLDFNGLTPKEMALLQSGGSREWWKEVQKNVHPNTFKQHRREYDRLRAAHDERTKTDVYGDTIRAAVGASLATSQGGGECTFFHTLSQLETGTHPHTPTTLLLPAAAGEGWEDGRQDGWEARPLAVVQSDDDEGASERAEGSMQARTPSAGGPVDGGSQHAPAPMEVRPAQPGQRYCHTCGLPINTGNPNAKFCSPKERGAQHAKQCKNADSNARLADRRKVEAREARIGGTLPLFAA